METIIFRAGMQSVNPSIKRCYGFLRKTTRVWLLQFCLPSLTGSEGIDGPRQFGASTFHTRSFGAFTFCSNQFGAFTFAVRDSRKACSILNNLTGRPRHSPRHCPVSADAIASQLVRNGRYEAVDRKSSRLVSKEASDLWRAITSDPVNICDTFSQREFIAAL